MACALWLAGCGLVGCRAPGPELAAWQPEGFLIGIRGAPPQQPVYYAQVATGGFNTIVDYVGPDALGLARRYGLKLMVGKIGLDITTVSTARGRRKAARLVERFRDHPALWGYYLGDHVRERQFDAYARLTAFVCEQAPGRPFLVGLLPSDAFVGPRLATADYAGYLDRFVRAVRPALLNCAHLPLKADGDSAFYFENLELVRQAALAHGLPFCPTLRGANAPGLRRLGEGELRWLVYTSLAYGATGIIWNAYWRRGSRDAAIVEPDGTPTERYRWIQALNAELRALGPELLRLRSVAVYHVGGETPVGCTRLPVHGLVGAVEGGAFVVGVFRGEGGEPHLLLVNKDYRKGADAEVRVNGPCRSVAAFDVAEGEWRKLDIRTDRLETLFSLSLPPGGGQLLRVRLVD